MESTRVKTHPLPSAHFDPRSASPTELRRYGLPQRPDASIRPELAALWDEILSHELTYLTPTFQPVETLLAGIEAPVALSRLELHRHEPHLVGLRRARSGRSDVHLGSGAVECPGCRTPHRRLG